MRDALKVLDVRIFVRAGQAKASTVLLLSALLVALHHYYGSMRFALVLFPAASTLQAAGYMFVTAFLLMGVVPALIVAGRGERLRDHGVSLGDWKAGVRTIAVLLPIIAVLALFPASRTPEMRSFYPLAPQVVPVEVARAVFFYTAWEFFFRGFMLFGLRGLVGDSTAICIQTIPSCLWHIGCPAGEILASIPGGLLFGLLAIRTRSVIWPWVLHCLIGITMDLLIVVTP